MRLLHDLSSYILIHIFFVLNLASHGWSSLDCVLKCASLRGIDPQQIECVTDTNECVDPLFIWKTKCISKRELCDGKKDCDNGEDEDPGICYNPIQCVDVFAAASAKTYHGPYSLIK